MPKEITFEDVKAMPVEQFIEICRKLANEKFEKISNEDFIMNAREALSTFEELIRDHYNENYLKEDCQNCLNELASLSFLNELKSDSKELLEKHIKSFEGNNNINYANDCIYYLGAIVPHVYSIKYSHKNLKSFIGDKTSQERMNEELTILFENLHKYIHIINIYIFSDFYKIDKEIYEKDDMDTESWIDLFKDGREALEFNSIKTEQIIQNCKDLEPTKKNIKFILSIVDKLIKIQRKFFEKFITKFLEESGNNVNRNFISRQIKESISFSDYDRIILFTTLLSQIESCAIIDNLEND